MLSTAIYLPFLCISSERACCFFLLDEQKPFVDEICFLLHRLKDLLFIV